MLRALRRLRRRVRARLSTPGQGRRSSTQRQRSVRELAAWLREPRPQRPLLPRLGPGALRWWVVAGLLLSAWVLLLPSSASPWALLPGDGSFPDLPATVQYYWVLQERGFLALAHDRMLMYPGTFNTLAMRGFPLDGLASQPFLALFGWPAGFTLFQITSLWCAGLSMAWLAGRWWRSPLAALVAGLALQASGPLVREMSYGRPTQVFAAIFAPLAFGLLARALLERRDRDALGAGVLLGLSTLAYWFAGLFYGLGFVVLLAMAVLERVSPWRPAALCAVSCLTVIVLPAAYTLSALSEMGTVNATLWTLVSHSGHQVPLAQILEQRDLFAALPEGIVGLTPLCFGAALFCLWSAPVRRWAAPLGWLLTGLALACGPWLQLSEDALLPGPFAWIPSVPVVSRLWWPDRAMLLVAPALALLAGGGIAALHRRLLPRWKAAWMALPVGALLLGEAFLGLPNLPMRATDGTPSPQAQILAQGTGPLLVLPQSGAASNARAFLLDQVFHGRPLVNGAIPPSSSTAPLAYAEVSALPAMKHLYGCFEDPWLEAASADSLVPLRRFGLQQVHVDVVKLPLFTQERGFLPGSTEGQNSNFRENYLACLEELLGPPTEVSSTFRVYSLDPEP